MNRELVYISASLFAAGLIARNEKQTDAVTKGMQLAQDLASIMPSPPDVDTSVSGGGHVDGTGPAPVVEHNVERHDVAPVVAAPVPHHQVAT